MTEFDDIRPYRDDEVRPTIAGLLANAELCDALVRLKFPKLHASLGWALRPLVKFKLSQQLSKVKDVRGFQQVVANYMDGVVANTVHKLSVSGLEKLDPQQSYLFISNHRDIAMDPAFVNWILFRRDCNTLRIAIGDNLLTKPFVSDIMRLNKCFVVNRSAKAPREKFKAAKHLSHYIHHSIASEHSSLWIAQREGRAKDGCDKTNSAVLSMIMLNKPKTQPLSEYVKELRIVPVAISYELDPCDAAKARELYQQRTLGSYQKEANEDIKSIAMGIAGQKGNVHLEFGEVLQGDYTDTDELVEDIDEHILRDYVLHASNCFAYEMLQGEAPKVNFSADNIPFISAQKSLELGPALAEQKTAFMTRMNAIPEEQRAIALGIYANPVLSKIAATAATQ
jgi:hypothetical protein